MKFLKPKHFSMSRLYSSCVTFFGGGSGRSGGRQVGSQPKRTQIDDQYRIERSANALARDYGIGHARTYEHQLGSRVSGSGSFLYGTLPSAGSENLPEAGSSYGNSDIVEEGTCTCYNGLPLIAHQGVLYRVSAMVDLEPDVAPLHGWEERAVPVFGTTPLDGDFRVGYWTTIFIAFKAYLIRIDAPTEPVPPCHREARFPAPCLGQYRIEDDGGLQYLTKILENEIVECLSETDREDDGSEYDIVEQSYSVLTATKLMRSEAKLLREWRGTRP